MIRYMTLVVLQLKWCVGLGKSIGNLWLKVVLTA